MRNMRNMQEPKNLGEVAVCGSWDLPAIADRGKAQSELQRNSAFSATSAHPLHVRYLPTSEIVANTAPIA